MNKKEHAIRAKAIVDDMVSVIVKHIPEATQAQISLIHEEYFKQLIGPSGAEQLKRDRNGKATKIFTPPRQRR